MRWIWVTMLILIGIGVGCTLSTTRPKTVVATATQPVLLLPSTATPIMPSPSAMVLPTATATPSPGNQLASVNTQQPLPSLNPTIEATLPILAPTQTPGAPTALPPLDDGSGHVIHDTGMITQAPVPGGRELPETLYYLSGPDDLLQVWRLQVGLSAPEQLTFGSIGMVAFDVASDGTIATIDKNGGMNIGEIPFAPPVGPDGKIPAVTALAWSPSGDWLAYTLKTLDPALPGGAHSIDGLWICRPSGQSPMRLAPNVYFDGSNATEVRIYSGPIDWRPNGVEILVRHDLHEGQASSRVNINSSAVMPVWNDAGLRPDQYRGARWSVNGTALIMDGVGQVLRVEPDTLSVQVLLGSEAGLSPENAQQFADGTVIFAAAASDGSRHLYRLSAGQNNPVTIMDGLPGNLESLWELTGRQSLIVLHDSSESTLGTPYLCDEGGILHDLTPLTGEVGIPQWGPLFQMNDPARTHTTNGDDLNVRTEPGGQIITQLPNGSLVTIAGGPRENTAGRWWMITTASGVVGWSVESVEEQGGKLRTLLPTP